MVLAFTDGDDTASRRGLGDVLKHAQEKEVMVYSIGLESEFLQSRQCRYQRVAASTAALRKAPKKPAAATSS